MRYGVATKDDKERKDNFSFSSIICMPHTRIENRGGIVSVRIYARDKAHSEIVEICSDRTSWMCKILNSLFSLQSTGKKNLFAVAEDDDDMSDSSEGSDFNEDDDPDNIEVPGKLRNGDKFFSKAKLICVCSGGGKDLETVSKFGKTNIELAGKSQGAPNITKLAMPSSSSGVTISLAPNHTVTSKTASNPRLPSGLVMKPNTTGFDVVMPKINPGKQNVV